MSISVSFEGRIGRTLILRAFPARRIRPKEIGGPLHSSRPWANLSKSPWSDLDGLRGAFEGAAGDERFAGEFEVPDDA